MAPTEEPNNIELTPEQEEALERAWEELDKENSDAE